MSISRMISCAALAGVLAVAAVPAPGSAQIGGLLKKVVKQKVTSTVVDRAANAAGVQPETASGAQAAPGADGATRTGLQFSEYLLEMTPEVLSRVEKGLAAEQAVQREIDGLIGKVLGTDERERCVQAVMASPEGQNVYMQAGDLMPDNASQEQLQKASREIAKRFDKLIEPKCGLDTQRQQQVRDQHAERLAAAAPQASGLTELQLANLKERIVPLCSAIETLSVNGNEARVPTEAQAVFWVYTPAEVEALRPRCAALMTALRAGA